MGSYGYSGYPYTYGAYPYSYGGYRYLGKRSADAEPEADAALLYGAYGYAGYAASPCTYGYSTYPYSYGGYPYTYGARYLGKRSADAEPEADAALLYGAYGYAGYSSPYSYGYSAY